MRIDIREWAGEVRVVQWREVHMGLAAVARCHVGRWCGTSTDDDVDRTVDGGSPATVAQRLLHGCPGHVRCCSAGYVAWTWVATPEAFFGQGFF